MAPFGSAPLIKMLPAGQVSRIVSPESSEVTVKIPNMNDEVTVAWAGAATRVTADTASRPAERPTRRPRRRVRTRSR